LSALQSHIAPESKSRSLHIQPKLEVGAVNSPEEKEADEVAEKVMRMPKGDSSHMSRNTFSIGSLGIQRKCNCTGKEEQVSSEKISIQKKEALFSTRSQFIVDDQSTPTAGQMTKSAFLELLNITTERTVNMAFANSPHTANDCPYLQMSFAKHQQSSPSYIENVIKRYAPATKSAQNAGDLIQILQYRIFNAAHLWVQNGASQIEDEKTLEGLLISTDLASKNVVSDASEIMLKVNSGGAMSNPSPTSPKAVMHSLGTGRALESKTKTNMESAFGADFSGVEIHTDSKAQSLSNDMNARAFTVGNHIAFAQGEYNPGSLMSDALLAHELAHVQQQRGGDLTGIGDTQKYEQEADSAALQAVTNIYDTEGKEQVQLKEKSGLRIQRCIKSCDGGPEVDDTIKDAPEKKKPIDKPSIAEPAEPAATPADPVATAPIAEKPAVIKLVKPSELPNDQAGSIKKRWRLNYKTKKEARGKMNAVKRLKVKTEGPVKVGKLWTFDYYPLTKKEAQAEQLKKELKLGKKYEVKVKYNKYFDTFYLQIKFKCPDAVPAKGSFEIWDACFSTKKLAETQLKKFEKAKIKAEIFELDTDQFSIYYIPFTKESAKAAGEKEISTRKGFAEGMFKVTVSENKKLKSFVYTTTSTCPAGYKDKGLFKITAYVLAQEKEFAKTPTVKDPCGLKGTYRKKFLFETGTHPRGVKMQGSGSAINGKIIQYEKKDGKDCFKESSCPKVRGKCMKAGVSVATDLKVIPRNSKLLIEDIGPRTAQDTGGSIKGNHIDVYYGTTKTMDQASRLSFKNKRVCMEEKKKEKKE